MIKKSTVFLLFLVAIVSITGCTSNKVDNDDSKIKVSVTFDAMKELVMAIGKDKVTISTIIPDGIEPHDFEPKAQDLVELTNAKVFVYHGLGMESWVDNAISSVNNKNLIVVDTSDNVTPITNTDPNTIKEHGQYDPHAWLSLKGAEIEAKNIRDGLKQADPSNKAYYEKNCNNFISQLENLYNEYDAKFQTVKNKNIVTGHAAFAYLCQDFGLNQNSVEDVFAEGEPSAKQLTKLINYCKDNKVTTIFAEEMASRDVSKTLANEVDAKVITIYTIESSEDNKTYLERMEDNLSKIYSSLSE